MIESIVHCLLQFASSCWRKCFKPAPEFFPDLWLCLKTLLFALICRIHGKRRNYDGKSIDVHFSWIGLGMYMVHGMQCKISGVAYHYEIKKMMLELEIKNENGEKEDIEKSQEGELADENSEEREAPEGTGYRTKTRFAKFFNLSELMNLFKQAADIQTADQLKLPVPEAQTHTVVVQPSELQKEMVANLSERAALVHNGLVDPSQDNI